MNLLLHTCCAPCSVYCIKSLRQEKIAPTLFWYNPNIHPYSEYKARRDCLKEYAKLKEVDLILEDNYGLDEFVCELLSTAPNSSTDSNSNPDQNPKPNLNLNQTPPDPNGFRQLMLSRCQNYCYPKRLRKLFEYAKEHSFDTVSTTLLYSIYQQHDIIKDLMEHLSREYQIDFLYRDFREGWQEGQDESRAIGLYMQKYCGCVFSEEESMVGREIGRKLKKNNISPTNQNVRKVIESSKNNGHFNPKNISI
ncbi:epoxyqueuosine reductase QueH [Candidatus Saccharibacteria bacterium]|nr:epoxyqueuosine reductase QueH [Candidatus Saccharibacteria bacterium]